MVPFLVSHHCSRIICIVCHGVGLIWLVTLSQAALIVGQHVERFAQRTVKRVGLVAQVSSGSRDEQQPLATASPFIVDIQAVDLRLRHQGLR